jgi:hypothetical protein
MTIEVRLEGFTLAVEDVNRSVELRSEVRLVMRSNHAPTFAMIRGAVFWAARYCSPPRVPRRRFRRTSDAGK